MDLKQMANDDTAPLFFHKFTRLMRFVCVLDCIVCVYVQITHFAL